MPPRTSWKGFLRLSLVSVPVKAYTASASGSEIRLNQLHDECKSRIKYVKTCPTHGAVGNDEIVKGYEYAKDQYVVIDTEELAKLRPQSDKTISMEGFVAADAIDPIQYSGQTYYTAPDGVAGTKPYHLLRQVMEDRDLCGIAKMVLSGKEQLVLVRPLSGLLALTMLSYPESVKDVEPFLEEAGDLSFTKEETQLTETLVEASLIEDFDFASYENDYVKHMNRLIQAKVEGEELVSAPSQEEPQILNLMEALKQSVAAAQDAAPPKKKAASAKTPAKKKMAKSQRKPAAKKKKTG